MQKEVLSLVNTPNPTTTTRMINSDLWTLTPATSPRNVVITSRMSSSLLHSIDSHAVNREILNYKPPMWWLHHAETAEATRILPCWVCHRMLNILEPGIAVMTWLFRCKSEASWSLGNFWNMNPRFKCPEIGLQAGWTNSLLGIGCGSRISSQYSQYMRPMLGIPRLSDLF